MHNDDNEWPADRKKRLEMEEIKEYLLPIKKIMFWGSGKETCERQARLLHQLIDDAISCSSGLQQPGHAESEEEYKQEMAWLKDGNLELDSIIRNIAVAFGRRIIFDAYD